MNIEFTYGSQEKRVDVTILAKNAFLKSNVLSVGAAVSFNRVFGDVLPGKLKTLEIRFLDDETLISLPETRSKEYVLSFGSDVEPIPKSIVQYRDASHTETFRNELIICGVFKNESHILAEWIDHYLALGADHIYLVNDNSSDEFLSIIQKYSNHVTLFNNDIVTKEEGRQRLIYAKYFASVLTNAKWAGILDLDEFLYSPTNIPVKDILKNKDECSQLKIDWLHFGSNDHQLQPTCVTAGFTKRALFTTREPYYSYKTLFKPAKLLQYGIHEHLVVGITDHLVYSDEVAPDLVINHYCIQSRDFFMNVKAVRGDCNNSDDDHIRNLNYFNSRDLNIVEDLRLFRQNKGKIPNRRVANDGDEVTMVITSCNRPHLLDRTLASFVSMNSYPIKTVLLIDDSGRIGCNDAVFQKYKDKLPIKNLYNRVNIGQTASIDKAYSYVTTQWIFHCEEDWVFLQSGFIEKSLRVFKENPLEKIYTVWLRPHHCTNGHPVIKDAYNRGYFMMDKDFNGWCGVTFNPGLRRTADCLLHHPYSLCLKPMMHKGTLYINEFTLNLKYKEDGFFSFILDDPNGHVNHIGWDDHIVRVWET